MSKGLMVHLIWEVAKERNPIGIQQQTQQPITYSSHHCKIAFLISYLTGRAMQCAAALWEKDSPVCDLFALFSIALRRVLDHLVKGKDVAKRLLALRQGSSSVADYAVNFRILATESGWDKLALQGIFAQGLSEEMKDEPGGNPAH